MAETDLVGRCGLYCGACSIYRAYKDDGEYLKGVAEHFKCSPEKVRCEGCQVLTPECWGNGCKIVQCLNSKGFDFCYECPQFDDRSCEKFEKLAQGYLEDNVDIRANLARIKSGQTAAWLKESRERFRCPSCRKCLPVGAKKCYIPQDSFPGFQKSFRNYPLLNPDLHPNDEVKLPWIHDVNAFLHSPFIMDDTELRRKVETIIAFIFKPEYQKLHPGYGVIRKGPCKYYVMGWSIHLPGYFKSSVQPKDFGHFLLMLNLMSRSRTAREHPWFKRSFSFLENFKVENDLIMFPRGFLPEKRSGYWVTGARMGLEPNRRAQKALKCESTFRYLEIATRVI